MNEIDKPKISSNFPNSRLPRSILSISWVFAFNPKFVFANASTLTSPHSFTCIILFSILSLFARVLQISIQCFMCFVANQYPTQNSAFVRADAFIFPSAILWLQKIILKIELRYWKKHQLKVLLIKKNSWQFKTSFRNLFA